VPDLAEGYEGEVDAVSMQSMDMKMVDDVALKDEGDDADVRRGWRSGYVIVGRDHF